MSLFCISFSKKSGGGGGGGGRRGENVQKYSNSFRKHHALREPTSAMIKLLELFFMFSSQCTFTLETTQRGCRLVFFNGLLNTVNYKKNLHFYFFYFNDKCWNPKLSKLTVKLCCHKDIKMGQYKAPSLPTQHTQKSQAFQTFILYTKNIKK